MRWIVAAILLVIGQAAVSGEENGEIEVDALVHAGERAVIRFHFEAPPVTDEGDPVNFLVLDVGGSYVDFLGDSQLLQSLHDGAELLATREAMRGDGLRALFIDSDVPWNGVEVDFTRIRDGSIEGVLVIEPVYDQRSGQSRIRFNGRLATGRVIENEGAFAGPSPVVTSCRIEAPIFGDRFGDEPYHLPGSQSYRDCAP
jgi:hypothetical protein